MKKTVWLALILMLLCVFALSACENVETPPNNNDNGQQTTVENNGGGEEDDISSSGSAVCQHTFGDWDTVKQATCKEEGKRIRTCDKCSETEEELIKKELKYKLYELYQKNPPNQNEIIKIIDKKESFFEKMFAFR